MAESLVQRLEREAFRAGVQSRTEESREWFRKKLKEIGSVNRQSLLKDPAFTRRQRFGIGNMYMFFYDPKHRDTLPYYDAFPLTIMVGPAPGGFYGLNLHYLHPKLRAELFDGLLGNLTNKRYDETTKFRLNYEMLQKARGLRGYKPCFKHYLRKQVDSSISLVEAPEWEIALFMPTEQFRKKQTRSVWADSRKMI